MVSRLGYLVATIAAAGMLAAGQSTFAQQPAPADNNPKPPHTQGGTAPGSGAHEHSSPPKPGEMKGMQDKQNSMPGMPCCSPAPKQ